MSSKFVYEWQGGPVDLYQAIDQFEAFLVGNSLSAKKGHRTQAAFNLGLNRTTYMMKLGRLSGLGLIKDVPQTQEG